MALWQDLHRGRDAGAMGLAPISWRDLDAFRSVTGARFSSEDLALIRVVEDEYHASRAAAEERRAKVPAKNGK